MEHREIPSLQMHRPHNWVVADEAARLALTPSADDIGKYLWQSDDSSEWVLVADSPVSWQPRGAKGDPGDPGAHGTDGSDGASAYEVAVTNGFVGSESEWLLSLKGDKGDPGDPGTDGADGGSAYEVAVANGFVGSEADWLLSLKGEKGDKGDKGDQGDPAPAGSYREKLSADRTYYVRTDGNDSNDGLANTSGGAFLTIQKAVDTAASLDLGIHNVTISIGAGTFDGATLKSFVGAGRINIVGAGTGSTIVRAIASGGTGYCFGNPPTAGHEGVYAISSLKMESVVSGRQGLDFIYGFNAQVVFGNVDFGSFAGGSHIRAGRGAIVTNASQSYTISGGGVNHAVAVEGGQIRFQSATITLSGAPAFSGPFASAHRGGTIAAFGNTFSGSATGARYDTSTAGGIYVAGAGTTYLPGNAAGNATSPGWYA